MSHLSKICSFFIILTEVWAIRALNQQKFEEERNSSDCNLYLAQSSVPHAGFGVFSARDISEGEYISPYADSPNIPLCDFHSDDAIANIEDYLMAGNAWGSYECNFSKYSSQLFHS